MDGTYYGRKKHAVIKTNEIMTSGNYYWRVNAKHWSQSEQHVEWNCCVLSNTMCTPLIKSASSQYLVRSCNNNNILPK